MKITVAHIYTFGINKMPRTRRSNIGRRTRHSAVVQNSRRTRSEEQRSRDNELQQERNLLRTRSTSIYPAAGRAGRLPRRAVAEMEFAAFNYDSEIDYSAHACIGQMTVRCPHCDAAKFRGETVGMCCANGKVKLPAFESPPDPLHSLIFGTSPLSKHFLSHIQEYNSSFQMTSFGATKIVRENFMPTFKVITSFGISNEPCNDNNKYLDVFKNSDPSTNYISHQIQIQGQIYHRAGSLLPFDDADYQFLQIYFIGDATRELDRRCTIVSSTKRQIISDLQIFFHQHNELIQLFKTALDRMPSDDHKIVIRADRTPFGEHARRFNAPTIDEVAILIVGQQFQSRDIVLHRRNENLQRVSELHRSYDALQYPLLYWRGGDGYHINIPMINPRTGKIYMNLIYIHLIIYLSS